MSNFKLSSIAQYLTQELIRSRIQMKNYKTVFEILKFDLDAKNSYERLQFLKRVRYVREKVNAENV